MASSMIPAPEAPASETPAPEPCLRLALTSGGPGGVLGAMSLTLRAGETLALTGPSGVGKTTLLRIVARLEPRFEGELHAPERIAMVFQEPALLPWRDATRNISIIAGIDAREARDWLARVGIADCAGSFPGQMSLGQQRRLALARAFAARPALLLMDEPFVSLDPETAAGMMTLFERLRDAMPVATILVTHVAEEADRLATRRLRLLGRPARLEPVGEGASP